MDELVAKARQYAISAHARINQLRKYTLQPYDVHLRAVAEIVGTVSDDPAMIAAAWLHDTVEDTPATFEDLEREFGNEVMELVKELTDVSRPGDGNRARRKEIDRMHLSGVSPRAKTIKLADVMDNCEDICRHDPKFGRTYLAEMKALMEVLREGEPRLYARAVRKIDACGARLERMQSSGGDDREDLLFRSIAGMPVQAGFHGIRLFTEAFSARDVQQMLLSYDKDSMSKLAERVREGRGPGIYGIRERGVVTGYVAVGDFAADPSEQVRLIDQRQVVDLRSPLADVIHVLTLFAWCFVSLDGTIIGVIGRGDMEKPVVRMWLFGIIILVEMLAVEEIRRLWPDQGWRVGLSEGRFQKALQLQAERQRRGLDADLLDCLLFSDKLQLLLKDPQFIETLGFQSTNAAKKVIKDLESLRNNLAHGQDITRHDWPQIVRLARRIQQLFAQ